MKSGILNKKLKYVQWNSVYYLFAINLIVFIAVRFFNIAIHGVPLLYWLSMIPSFVKGGFVWQFVTTMFVHYDIGHFICNMYVLIVFGAMVERQLGSKEFLLFYLVCGTLSSIASFLIFLLLGQNYTVLMGASGALNAIFFLVAVMFPRDRVLLFFFIPLSMPMCVLVLLAISLISQFSGAYSNVSHITHIMGILFAWLYCLIRYRIDPIKIWKNAR